MKKVALYSPYLPKHYGGGERYILSIAEVAAQNAQVSLLVPGDRVDEMREALPRYESTFGLRLGNIMVLPTTIGGHKHPLSILQQTRAFDVLFALTDGSIFASGAQRSYLISQLPWTRTLSLAERVKLLTWKHVLVYSHFVEQVLRRSWRTSRTKVLSPYVDTRDFSPPTTRKEKLILSIGRFFSHTTSNSKRQDTLIEAFKQLVDRSHIREWTLVLIGNVEDPAYLSELKIQAKGYPIRFETECPYDELRSWCQRASIYWHAAGYGVDERVHPEQTEHFGITTLEAMASGCIPLVVPRGGQPEIVAHPDWYWETIDELVARTRSVITLPSEEFAHWSQVAVKRAQVYTKDEFAAQVKALL